ncbi:glutamyl-tRNA synthetase or glutamyl-Q tRNA(Asp) synthetase [Mycobacteroides abscessus subsp. abscessus]|nr:glutamyl-tRNA synthetase or glutamyl-Q tRNA(Asp) synthetase [Mycobacteroides abscessus subsp. abscessus]
MLNKDGQRLAKRDGAVTLADQQRAGKSPEQVLALLTDSLGLPPRPPRELLADRTSSTDH